MLFIDDPETRQWRRIGAVSSIAVTAAFVAGVTWIGAHASSPRGTALAVNCATEGLSPTIFDDSGTHSAMCAGQVPEPATRVADTRMPPPSSTATAEPLPPTF